MNRSATFWAFAMAHLAGPAGLLAQEAEGGGGGLFSINFGLSAWTVVVFVALLLVLGKYAWGPILDAVEAREAHIRGALDEAALRQEEAERLAADQRERLSEARREAQDIIAEGREAGEKVRREIEEKAREESQKILERARAEIGRERDAALETVRHEAVELALGAAARLLGERLDEGRDRELVLEYLDDLAEEGEEPGARA